MVWARTSWASMSSACSAVAGADATGGTTTVVEGAGWTVTGGDGWTVTGGAGWIVTDGWPGCTVTDPPGCTLTCASESPATTARPSAVTAANAILTDIACPLSADGVRFAIRLASQGATGMPLELGDAPRHPGRPGNGQNGHLGHVALVPALDCSGGGTPWSGTVFATPQCDAGR